MSRVTTKKLEEFVHLVKIPLYVKKLSNRNIFSYINNKLNDKIKSKYHSNILI